MNILEQFYINEELEDVKSEITYIFFVNKS